MLLSLPWCWGGGYSISYNIIATCSCYIKLGEHMCFIKLLSTIILSHSCNSSQWQWLYCHILQAGGTRCQMEGHRKSSGVHWRRDGQHRRSSVPDEASPQQLARGNADSVVGVGPRRWAWQCGVCHKRGPSCGTLEGQPRTTSSAVSVNNCYSDSIIHSLFNYLICVLSILCCIQTWQSLIKDNVIYSRLCACMRNT